MKLCHDLYYLKRRSPLVNVMMVLETLMIAGLDAHRPLRVPASQFFFGRDLGLDIAAKEIEAREAASGPPPSPERSLSRSGADGARRSS